MTYQEAHRIAMVAALDALLRADGGEKGFRAACNAFEAVMASLGYASKQKD